MNDSIRDEAGRDIAPAQPDAPRPRPQGPWDNNTARYEHLAPKADQVERMMKRMGGSHAA